MTQLHNIFIAYPLIPLSVANILCKFDNRRSVFSDKLVFVKAHTNSSVTYSVEEVDAIFFMNNTTSSMFFIRSICAGKDNVLESRNTKKNEKLPRTNINKDGYIYCYSR